MSYIDGFVIAVPKANKQKFIDHATNADSMFMEMGAIRVFECWADDVPDGKLTDFRMAVKATEDEDVGYMDKWGISWQITSRVLTQAMAQGGDVAKRAFEAMMTMKKIDVAAIEAAVRG
jgi:uncharacterized protein YbaA (DUF1428 family)